MKIAWHKFWPEVTLATLFLLCAVAATWLHRQFGVPILMLGEINIVESNWDLFWMPGAPDKDIARQWWFGLGYSWWNLFVLPLLTYGIGRAIWTIRKLRTKH